MGIVDSMAANLRAARRRRKWTQEQLAERMGVDQSTVSARERGGRGWEDFRRFVGQLERAGIDPSELVRQPGDLDADTMRIARMVQAAPPDLRQAIALLLSGHTSVAGEAAPPPPPNVRTIPRRRR